MEIRKATAQDKKAAIKIAKNLKDWFTAKAIKNMLIDFRLNSLVVAVDKKEVLGFLCYTSYCGRFLLLWIGVDLRYQRMGVGGKLLKWIQKEAKKLRLYSLEGETLPEEEDYEPYKRTRAFFYKNGFKRIAYKKARIKGWDNQIVIEKLIN